MAQQQAKKKKKKDNCTYDSLYGFVKQASVWVVGAVWKKNTAIFKSTLILIMLNQGLNDLRLNQKMVLMVQTHGNTRHKAGRTTLLPLPQRLGSQNELPQSTFCRHCG